MTENKETESRVGCVGVGCIYICDNILEKESGYIYYAHQLKMFIPFDPVNSISLSPPESFRNES